MNSSWLIRTLALGALGLAFAGRAQDLRFTDIVRLTNGQVLLKFSAPTGVNFHLNAATNFTQASTSGWDLLINTQSVGLNLYTDAVAASASARFYRASSNILSGDALATTNGDLVIHPLYHASLLMSWNGKVIYSDPDDDPAYESRYPAGVLGDVILVTHEHTDHYATAKLTALRKPTGVIIVPQRVYNMSSFASFRPNAFVLAYGGSTNVNGINILATPGYNNNHAYTTNNCYVLTLGGKKIFISGDTGDVPEIRALTGIDVAFLCMNQQFTMNWLSATNAIRSMRPKVVYPYHYREGNGAQTNAALFNAAMSNVPDIEVRLRNWY